MDARTKYDFSIFDRKFPFWVNLVQKIKIVSLSRSLVPRLIRICSAEFNGAVHFFCFIPETPILYNFCQKNQNCQFKLKSATQTNSNMQNSIVVLTFSDLYRKHLFR